MRKWATQFYEVPATPPGVGARVGMRIDLAESPRPAHTAIVTQECQGAVVGPNAGLAVLANEARREALPEHRTTAARRAGMPA